MICAAHRLLLDHARTRAWGSDRLPDHRDAAQRDECRHRPSLVAGTAQVPEAAVCAVRGLIGWLPYWLERVDYVYEQHRFWTHQDFGDQLPSQVARDHFTFCFISDAAGVEARAPDRRRQHHLGVRLPALRLELAAFAGVGGQAVRPACPMRTSTRSPTPTPCASSSSTRSRRARRGKVHGARLAGRGRLTLEVAVRGLVGGPAGARR